MVTIEKRGDNSYRLTVSCGYDSNNKKIVKRKTIKLTPGLTDKQIEKELSVQSSLFEREVQTGTYLDAKITLNEFAEKWMKDYAEVNLRPKTIARYKQLLKRILKALGHKRIDSIQPTHLLEFYKNLSEGGIRDDYKYKIKPNTSADIPEFTEKASKADINPRTLKNILQGQPTKKAVAEKICKAIGLPLKKIFDVVDQDKKLSEMTIRHHHRLISAMFTSAVQWQLIMSNPAERVKPPTVKKKEARYYDIDQVNTMLALLNDEPIKYRVMVYIVIFCGLRLGELVNLEWSDIDFENGLLTISKQLQYLPEYGIYEMKTAKTETGNRTISIPSSLISLLQEYQKWQNDEIQKLGDRWIGSNKLFTKENGEPIYPGTPSKWFSKFIERNNLPPLTFHQLRHTNASLLISQGVDVATVSKRLGHADVSVTLRTYTHALKQKDKEAIEKLENVIKPEA